MGLGVGGGGLAEGNKLEIGGLWVGRWDPGEVVGGLGEGNGF